MKTIDPIQFQDAYRAAWEALNRKEERVAKSPTVQPPGVGVRSVEAQAILDLLFEKGPMTRRGMRMTLNMGDRRIERGLGRLIDTHLVAASASADPSHHRAIHYGITLRGISEVTKGASDA